MKIAVFLSLPVLSALIGWFTNFIAIRMLFHPREKISILGFSFQGLLPRRQEDIAVQVSETVEDELFTSEDILNGLEKVDFDRDIEEFIDRVVESHLPRFLDGIPLVGSFISDGILSKLKSVFKKEVKKYTASLGREIAEHAVEAIDIKQTVYEKISDYDIGRLEGIVKRIAKKELRHIELLGGVLGFLVGCVQAAILWIMGMVAV